MLRRFPEKREIDKSTRNRDAEPDLKTKEIQPPDTLNSPQFCRGMSQFRSKQTPKLQNKHYITCTFNKTVNRTIHIIHIKVIFIEIDPSAHRWCCAFYQVHDQWLISSPWQLCRPQLIAKQHCKISPHLDRQLSYVILVDFRHTAVALVSPICPGVISWGPTRKWGLLVTNWSLTAGMCLIPWIWSCVIK